MIKLEKLVPCGQAANTYTLELNAFGSNPGSTTFWPCALSTPQFLLLENENNNGTDVGEPP